MAITVSKVFKDISLSFRKHPVTNDILPIKNEDAIKKAVQNLIKTRIGERFYDSDLGTTIESNLFELAGKESSLILKEEIRTILKNYEPRVRLRRVDVDVPDDMNELNIRINYDIVGQGFGNQEIEFLLSPSRL